MGCKIVIVGGVAGGATAAARLRRLSESDSILILEKGGSISFANCGMPYYIGGEIAPRQKLILQSPQSMDARYNIQVRVLNQVERVEPESRKLWVRDLHTGIVYTEDYDVLILSPGAVPVSPPIPGVDSPLVFKLWSLEDCDRIYNYLEQASQKPGFKKKAIVAGGGFVGLEMAENFKRRGLEVTLVEAGKQILPALDPDMAALVQSHMEEMGVAVIREQKAETFYQEEDSLLVRLSNGELLAGDFALFAGGVRPNTGFLEGSGIAMAENGAILTDSSMKTNYENIYALGDAVMVRDIISGQEVLRPMAGHANKQGRIAADAINGKKRKYGGSLGVGVIRVFGMTAAYVGMNEKSLNQRGMDYIYSIASPLSHAGYFPGAEKMDIKLLYNQEGAILGAQIVGGKAVDKGIDVIAAVMAMDGGVNDLAELELCYAPPFSSAKNPVNIAGFLAQNVIENELRMAYWDEISRINKESVVLLDVRNLNEWEEYHIPGSTLIPLSSLRESLHILPRNGEIIVMCAVGQRAYTAARILTGSGFRNVRVLTGGVNFYRNAINKVIV